MHRIIVIQFITLDGIVEDPDGSAGTPRGGWAFRFGPEAVAGDKFRLGPRLDDSVLLLGRGTWQLFSRLWPHRSDDFSMRMNAAQKRVMSRTLTDVSAWPHSSVIAGELPAVVGQMREDQDVIVIGSVGVVHELARHDLVDEYRLLMFPTVVGTGRRLFETPDRVQDLRLVSVEKPGAAALMCYERTSVAR